MTRSASVRSQALAIAARIFMRPIVELIPSTKISVRGSRVFVAAAMFLGSPPPYRARITKLVERGGSVRGEWVHPHGVTHSAKSPVILYIHGSGYAICSAATHRGLVARLAHATGMAVFSVDYRLAPAHRFPRAADDVEAAYQWLRDRGHSANDIVLAGDSAGGHLIIDLLAENTRTGRPQPATAVMMSPLLDLSLSLAEHRERSRTDPLISAKRARQLVGHYIRDVPDTLPRLALTLAQADDLPRTLIQVGGREMLLADAVAAHKLLTKAGADCTLRVWPGQIHVFQAMPTIVPEANLALREAANFITSHQLTRSA